MRLALGTAVLALTLAVAPLAGASHNGSDDPSNATDWANGGGQIVTDPNSLSGAGDAIGFSARALPDRTRVTGQVQYTGTSLPGRTLERWHGTVTCFTAEGNRARIGGVITSGTIAGRFALEIVDAGRARDSGPGSQPLPDAVALAFGPDTESDCDADDFASDDELVLARGNATVHDAG